MINRILALLICSTMLTACPPRRQLVELVPATVEQSFIQTIQGFYDNKIQSTESTETLHKELVVFPIWSDEGYYTLYFEEFEVANPDDTRRQWVLWVDAIDNGEIVAYTYKLLNPETFAGSTDASAFDPYSYDEILEACWECEITLKQLAYGRYSGSSSGWTCNCWSGEAIYYQLSMDVNLDVLTWSIQGFDGDGTCIEGMTPTIYHK